MQEKVIGLVTGASAGLGAEFCRQLVERCRKLIIVGRRADRLRELAESLQQQGVETVVVCEDLTTPLGLTEVVEKIRQQGPVQLLVNNAGFATQGAFVEVDYEQQQAMVDLQISATMRLCRAVIPYMKAEGAGTIINVSSMMAFAPAAEWAVYAASKSFLNSFSQSLQSEVAEDNIKVQCLCPGYTRTEFFDRPALDNFDAAAVPEERWMSAREVVAESLVALDNNDEVIVIAGEHNRLRLHPAS